MLQSLTEVLLFVSDIRRSRDWYQAMLGLAPAEDSPEFVSFQLGPHRLSLHRADDKSPLSPGGSVAYWWVSDFDAVIAKAMSLGGRVYRGPIDIPGGRRMCQIMDPFGNVFGIQGQAVAPHC